MRSLIVTFLAASVTLAAPALKPITRIYSPTHVGDKRVYELKDGDDIVMEHTDIVTNVEEKDGKLRVTHGRVLDGMTIPWAELEVSEKGVLQHMMAGMKMASPVPNLLLSMKRGEKWEHQPDTKIHKQGGSTTYVFVGEEEIEVPAGKFKAIRIESEKESGGKPMRQTRWYALNVGLVKLRTLDGEVEHVQSLKSFTSGK